MPFIAIALALTFFLGGSAVVAENTTQGRAAASHVVQAWNQLEANADAHAAVTTDATASSSADATSASPRPLNGLMIRADDNTNVQTQSPALNADGSVKVKIF